MEVITFKEKPYYGGPWKIVWVYSRDRSYKLIGWYKPLHDWIDRNVEKPYIYHQTFWRGGKCIGSDWSIKGGSLLYLDSPDTCYHGQRVGTRRRKRHFEFRYGPSDMKGSKILLKLRKIPRMWIPEYDRVIEESNKLYGDARRREAKLSS